MFLIIFFNDIFEDEKELGYNFLGRENVQKKDVDYWYFQCVRLVFEKKNSFWLILILLYSMFLFLKDGQR